MTLIDAGHLVIGRRIELGIRSMAESTLVYGGLALIGALALTALEAGTYVAPVTPPPVAIPTKAT